MSILLGVIDHFKKKKKRKKGKKVLI